MTNKMHLINILQFLECLVSTTAAYTPLLAGVMPANELPCHRAHDRPELCFDSYNSQH